MKKRLKPSTTTATASTTPKPDHRKLALTRLLTERTDILRQEFIGHRLNRKSVLVKEQVQTQRLKQQQVILKQQQATIEKEEEEESSSDANNNKPNSPPPPAKKSRKSTGNETKKTPKTTSESKAKRYLIDLYFSHLFSLFFLVHHLNEPDHCLQPNPWKVIHHLLRKKHAENLRIMMKMLQPIVVNPHRAVRQK